MIAKLFKHSGNLESFFKLHLSEFSPRSCCPIRLIFLFISCISSVFLPAVIHGHVVLKGQ